MACNISRAPGLGRTLQRLAQIVAGDVGTSSGQLRETLWEARMRRGAVVQPVGADRRQPPRPRWSARPSASRGFRSSTRRSPTIACGSPPTSSIQVECFHKCRVQDWNAISLTLYFFWRKFFRWFSAHNAVLPGINGTVDTHFLRRISVEML